MCSLAKGKVQDNDISTNVSNWLSSIFKQTNVGDVLLRFPSEDYLDYYLDNIAEKKELEVITLLEYLLISSTVNRFDEINHLALQKLPQLSKASGIDMPIERTQLTRRRSSFFSKLSNIPPWEGITWALDLLPDKPVKALAVLESYINAHLMHLSDDMIWALSDAQAIIRAKYIGLPKSYTGKRDFLLNLDPRHFEHLCERLYSAMGYHTVLTKRSHDDGRDIIATNNKPARKEVVQIECKRHKKRVGVPYVRQLLGVVSNEKSSRGVIIGLSGFTKPAIKFANNNRLELLSGDELIALFNEYLGSRWIKIVDRLIQESEQYCAKN